MCSTLQGGLGQRWGPGDGTTSWALPCTKHAAVKSISLWSWLATLSLALRVPSVFWFFLLVLGNPKTLKTFLFSLSLSLSLNSLVGWQAAAGRPHLEPAAAAAVAKELAASGGLPPGVAAPGAVGWAPEGAAEVAAWAAEGLALAAAAAA